MTLLERLSAPFPAATVSWRVGATTKDKARGMALAYIDARDVQDRLNEVCGHEWQVKHHHCGGEKLACEIGIKIDGEWLWRGDGAGQSDVEAEKGAFSDSFKRAAVRWGIGRYLYDTSSPWVELEAKGNTHIIPERELARLRAILAGKTQSNVSTNGREHPKWDYAGARFREIERALNGSKQSKNVDDVWMNNKVDLALIERLHRPSYQRLEKLRDEMLAKLGSLLPTAEEAGSAPNLTGES